MYFKVPAPSQPSEIDSPATYVFLHHIQLCFSQSEEEKDEATHSFFLSKLGGINEDSQDFDINITIRGTLADFEVELLSNSSVHQNHVSFLGCRPWRGFFCIIPTLRDTISAFLLVFIVIY